MSPRFVKIISVLPVAGALVFGAVGCGDPGSSGTTAPEDVSGEGCEPVAGNTLVALEDDKKLQASENVLAAFHSEAGDSAAVEATDAVAAGLSTKDLTTLNKAVEVDRKSPSKAAKDFAADLDLDDLGSGEGEIVVGHADYTESEIVANLYQIALDEAGFEAETQDVGNRETYLPALKKGEVQVVPEYAGSLAEALNPDADADSAKDPVASSDIKSTMKTLEPFADEAGLALSKPAEASSQNAYVVTEGFAKEHDVATLSEFGEKCSGAASSLAGPPECQERLYCQAGLEDTYGIQFGKFDSLGIGTAAKQSVVSGESTVGTVISTDSALAEGVSVEPDKDKKD